MVTNLLTGPENLASLWGKSESESENKRMPMSQPEYGQAEIGGAPLHILVMMFRPLTNWMRPPILWKAICHRYFTGSYLNLTPNHPHRHSLSSVKQMSGHPVAQSI